jgi:2-polyprenyl-3-methyl-5-hydroxy-6-metoxy-1,4-benzoquinol methylase
LDGYDDIAALYNLAVERELGASGFAQSAACGLLGFCKSRGFEYEGRHLVDLGCGTGQFAVQLAKRGMRVTGLDISEPMLQIARANARMHGVHERVTFQCANVVDFELPSQAALVTATFNVINHFQASDLPRLFAAAHASLDDRGLLIFDLNTEAQLSRWNRTEYQEITGDFEQFEGASVIKRTAYDPMLRRARREVICFCRRKDHVTYERRVGTTYSHAHGVAQLAQVLHTVGFACVTFADSALRSLSPQQAPEELDVVFVIAEKRRTP